MVLYLDLSTDKVIFCLADNKSLFELDGGRSHAQSKGQRNVAVTPGCTSVMYLLLYSTGCLLDCFENYTGFVGLYLLDYIKKKSAQRCNSL